MKNLPTQSAGKTGRTVSRLTIGGVKWDTKISEPEAVELLRRAVDLGVTSFDTAHGYGGGQSEIRLGKALHDQFENLFISTKTTARNYDEARKEIEISLQRMNTDHVDLVYVHALDDEEDYKKVTGKHGTLQALRDCREEGMIDFIGVSGHWYRHVMEKLIREQEIDALLFPVGLFNRAYGHDFTETILPMARGKGIATFGMKVFAAGRIKHVNDLTPYIRYSLHQPVDSLVIGCDSISQLEEQVQQISSNPPPLSPEECEALKAECFEVTRDFDEGEYNWVSYYKKTGPLSS